MSGGEDEFDIKLWVLETHISDAGLKKLANNAVEDFQSLQLMTVENIASMKLAAADSAKFFHALRQLDPLPVSVRLEPKPVPAPTSSQTRQSANEASGSTDIDNSNVASHNNGGPAIIVQSSQDPGANPQVQHPVNASVDSLNVSMKQFSLEEVSSFLAGNSLPTHLNAYMNQRPTAPNSNLAPSLFSDASQNLGLPSMLNTPATPSTVPVYGSLQNQLPSSYQPAQSSLPWPYQQTSPTGALQQPS
jgi:hypothetical protein